MKSILNSGYALLGMLFLSMSSFVEVETNHSLITSKRETKMETSKNIDTREVCFIDKFLVPKESITEFTQKMNYNREFIKKIPGFVKSEAYLHYDSEGNVTIITIAVWKNQDNLDKAKALVQAEFKRVNFNPADFYQRLNVKLERGLYQKINE